jgi:BlaI family penicillinase repressor
MDAVWSAAPITASDVIDSLSPRFGWSANTIKTMLNRLVKKRALKFEQDGKRYLYRPAVSREACVRVESRSFLQRVFGGDVAPMLAHFVEDAQLSPEQLKQLRKLLDQKRD